MMRFSLFLLFFLLSVVVADAQTNSIKELEQRHIALKEEIKRTQKLLQHTNNNLSSQINKVALLNAQINERKRYLLLINADLAKIDKEITLLTQQLYKLQRQLKDIKGNYAQSVRYLHKNRSIQYQLMFLFSADNFNQFYRRLKYVSQFADYQRGQGLNILQKSEEIRLKKNQREKTKLIKSNLLINRQKEYDILQKEELDKKQLLNNLRQKRRQLNAEIKNKEKQAKRLNDMIDRLVALEIKKSTTNGDSSAYDKASSHESVDYKLANDFAKNKGRLPLPIIGSALIVNSFGKYSVDGLRYVQLDNKGIDIQAEPGAKARAIFKGKVVAIFKLENLFNILVRHGNYISVYCNLINVQVKKMQIVDTMQPLGEVYTNLHQGGQTILHFQLRKEKAKLNPEDWIRKE